jgi:hypothetical protein
LLLGCERGKERKQHKGDKNQNTSGHSSHLRSLMPRSAGTRHLLPLRLLALGTP